ncbi:uncharacterized protein DUF1735 [Dyadobacter jejuensis]|uniref:Uncharacterized protein DUF1735 n=1 Tax=Dyadobacter jejuensis TaxID=1082580 RepID=A0A316AIR2_9BACT|nr:DUF1735 domain-containing protein [Dyadobacter jejuensis]PWJ56854.1 uncharacterized protein DUF1735 [Dyadobacter jejuensis]
MKKNSLISILLLGILTSCYKDYIDDFDHDAIYFNYQTNVRTFVVGEGMKIEVGASLAGVRDNRQDRIVNFSLDNSLITSDILAVMKSGLGYIKDAIAPVTELKPLPTSYFTISDPSQMVIKKGTYMGSVVIKADSAAFLKDPATIHPVYALPFYIKSADADSVLSAKRYAVIALKYENMLFGNYYHGGVTVVKDSSGKILKTTNYYTTIPTPEIKMMTLQTVAPNALITNKISDQSGAMKITLADGNVTVSQAEGSSVVVLPDGTSSFNRSKLLQDRKLYLNYKFANPDGTTSYAQDTLTFRNRIRDGVNEWQDEDPSHY